MFINILMNEENGKMRAYNVDEISSLTYSGTQNITVNFKYEYHRKPITVHYSSVEKAKEIYYDLLRQIGNRANKENVLCKE